MKFIPLALIASVCAPVASLGLRSLRNRSPDKSNKGSEAEAVVAAAVVGERELLSTWCKTDTPVAWHPNYAEAWSNAKCIYTQDCNSPAFDTELACCDGAYGGQVSGACKAGLVNPSTVPTKWYPDYVTSWAIAGCKNEPPYPNYITDSIKFDTQLACCKGTFGGQTSGSCIAGLLIKPTMAPITAGGVGGKCETDTPAAWHPNYAEAWSNAKCIYTQDCNSPAFDTELACCDGAYGGQVSGACKAGLVNPSTVPTKWYPDYVTSWAIAGCKNEPPYPNYITDSIKFDTQLACCKGAFGGQTSGSCIAGLPIKPTMAPVTAGGVGGKWYADYGVAWSIAGCKNTFPYPNYAAMFYGSHLDCCKGAFGGQVSNACLMGLPMAPTLLPTVAPTSKPTAVPTSKPTSKPTFEPTVTPSITIISEVNATLTVGARRLGMPLF